MVTNFTSHNLGDEREQEVSSSGPTLDGEDILDGDHLLRCLRTASAWLDAHAAQINALNVFPVPDGDTGTNMSLTMRAALDEAGSGPYSAVSDVARVVSHGALMGARGNSGVILSQLLRGFARALDGKDVLTPHSLAEALREAAATAYKGVMKPVEGTILTVAREAAQAAEQMADSGGDVRQVIEATTLAAEEALARTPSMLPVLAEAGVVDAGGQGLTIFFQGVLRHLRGERAIPTTVQPTEISHAEAPNGQYNYDTQFIIIGQDLEPEKIRERIAQMGDSVLVVGDRQTVKVHVHADNPGQVLDYGISQGSVTSIIIENMQLQYEQFKASRQPVPVQPATVRTNGSSQRPASDIGVVAVVSGEGLQRVFESLGVSAVVPGGQTMNPSTQDLLTAINSVEHDQIILLPNNSNIILTAQQAKELSSKQVLVVSTKTVPQGIAALLAFNYQASLQSNAELMQEAAKQVQTAEVTQAVRSVQVNGLSIAEGQVIGLLNDNLTTAGEDVSAVVLDLLERVHTEEREIITIYYGENISDGEARALAEEITAAYPDLEVEVHDGGQAHYYYIISVE